MMSESYPTEILPSPGYKEKMETDYLLTKYPDLLVVRLVEGHVEDYYLNTENNDRVLSDKVFKNNMANLSMNLAGGLFNTSSDAHLRFLPATKEATETWDGGYVDPILYTTENSYHFYATCFGLCFFVRDIHNRTFPFYKHFESQEERNEYEENVKKNVSEAERSYDAHLVGAFESKKKMALINPRLKVHHEPSKVNYWHMTLDTYRPTDISYIHSEDKQNSGDRKMFKALKQDLLQCYSIDRNPNYCINPTDYLKSE